MAERGAEESYLVKVKSIRTPRFRVSVVCWLGREGSSGGTEPTEKEDTQFFLKTQSR